MKRSPVKKINAHVGHKGAGAGRKADYDQIAPLCRRCHQSGTPTPFMSTHSYSFPAEVRADG